MQVAFVDSIISMIEENLYFPWIFDSRVLPIFTYKHTENLYIIKHSNSWFIFINKNNLKLVKLVKIFDVDQLRSNSIWYN